MLRIGSIQLNKASAYQRAARWTCCRVSPVCHSYSSAIPPLKPIRERRDWDITVPSPSLWKSEMRVIVATFMGLVALAVAQVQLRRTRTRITGSSLVPRAPSSWETKPAGSVGIRPSGATGGATGGGERAFRICTDHEA